MNDSLIEAITDNNIEKVKLLLEKGADVNYADKLEFNTLMIASEKGYIEIVKLSIFEYTLYIKFKLYSRQILI